MNDKTIKELAVELTVEITAICDNIKGRAVYVNQLLRSCSSIGADFKRWKFVHTGCLRMHRRLMQYGYDGFAVFEQLEEQKESKDMLNDVLQSMMR